MSVPSKLHLAVVQEGDGNTHCTPSTAATVAEEMMLENMFRTRDKLLEFVAIEDDEETVEAINALCLQMDKEHSPIIDVLHSIVWTAFELGQKYPKKVE